MDPQAQPQVQQPPQNEGQMQAPDSTEETKQQIVRAIESGKNVLVTVGSNPSVDQLASAIGLTLMLGKLDKHATAVFSGKIPSAMEFLDPEKVFERSVDSLRDFIIALDKEKADKLRYKVEDEVVKIFITPYKTVLSQKDLQFSQGDFNVDVVIALGVTKREDLDSAITSHGRILHDATVITINAGNRQSNLGAIDWNNQNASSVAEMLVSLASTFGGTVLDGQISTAYLTGIVAETNRFSNEKTSPQVMTMSAQLMAAGANQQLIATNLRQEGMISEPVRSKKEEQPHDDNGEMVLDHKPPGDSEAENGSTDEGNKTATKKKAASEKADSENTASSSKKPATDSNDKKSDSEEATTSTKEEDTKNSKQSPSAADELQSAVDEAAKPTTDKTSADVQLAEKKDELPHVDASVKEEVVSHKPSDQRQHKVIEPLPKLSDSMPAADASQGVSFGDSSQTTQPATASATPTITAEPPKTETTKPTFGGTLNATTAGAEEDRAEQAKREAEVNHTALSHDQPSDMQDVSASLEDARKAVQDAASSQPFNPANQPIQALNSQPLPRVEPSTAPDGSAQQVQAVPNPTQQTEPDPVDAFMQTHQQPQANPNATTYNPVTPSSSAGPTPSDQSLPPLPPLPGSDAHMNQPQNGLPPLPPLPGQPTNQNNPMQPQINPGFVQNMPQSANPWTSAGQDLSQQQSDKDAARQEKMDKMNEQYDRAVDRNRELQGLPPLNNPNGSGLPPVPPQK